VSYSRLPERHLTRYDALLMRLEREARDNPAGYRFRLGMIGALGYLFITLCVLFALGLLGGLVAFGAWVIALMRNPVHMIGLAKLLVPAGLGLLAFVGIVLRSLFVHIPEPEGMTLERGLAVPLFREIDRLRASLQVPAFHRVILTDEFNAAVVQVPRLGIFGWQKNYLLLGLPLMLSLSQDQFRAVLAHEMGHISGAHGRFNVWVYRINLTWFQMLHAFEQEDHNGGAVFETFFEWYAPYFWANSFSLRRACEYEADKAAAQAVGARTVADALVASNLSLYRMMHQGPVEARDPQRWLNAAASRPDTWDDEHPSLANRLRALGQAPRLPEADGPSAAEALLGHNILRLAQSVGMVVLSAGSAPETPAPAAPAPAPAPVAQAAAFEGPSSLRPIGG